MKNVKLIKICFLFVLAVMLQLKTVNAQNLVPNPSFEEYDYCWPEIGAIVKDWDSYSGSPDYFHICVNYQFGVPNNPFGYQQPVSGGLAYYGIYVYNNYSWVPNPDTTYREMIGTELLSPMIIGRKYYVSYKVSLSNIDFCASNNIGVLFSTVPHIDTMQTFSTWDIQNFSHINSYNIISDTLNWNNINGSFIADSAYKFVIIGNFYNNFNTDILITNPDTNCQIYYYIDDICVSEDSLTCNLPTEITKNNMIDKIKIFPNPANNILYIESKFLEKEIEKIIIYNSQGIIEDVFCDFKDNYINLENFKSGLYYVCVYLDNQIITRKFIIN